MLTGELLAKVRKIEIKTRRMVDEITGGAYHSVFKGRGIEFSDVREYTSDDDVRDIDWNVTARTGVPYIKKYAEERELTVLLAVDVSASGLFGTEGTEKREKMAEAAALLAFSAIRNNDKVGLLLFSDRTELYLPPRSGRTHGLRVIRELVAMEPEGKGTNIGGALEELAGSLKKKTVIFLISDFLDEKNYEKTLKIISRMHDVVAVRIMDQAEMNLPCDLPGLTLEGIEDGRTYRYNGTSADYAEAAGILSEQTKELCKRAKIDMIDVRCRDDLVKPLLLFFRNRKMKR